MCSSGATQLRRVRRHQRAHLNSWRVHVQARISASYGVLEYVQRTEGWLAKCSRYSRGAALSMEKVVDQLNSGFDPLVAAMNEQLTKLGATEEVVAPLAAKAAEFISAARKLAQVRPQV
jgi:hypothetical protein